MRTIFAAALLVISAGAANAHITSSPDKCSSEQSFHRAFHRAAWMRGVADHSVRITLPDGLNDVKPEHKPGWKITTKRYKFAGPKPQTLGSPEEIEWRGGPLPDDEYESFGVTMLLPPQPGILYFPTVQTCEKGEIAG